MLVWPVKSGKIEDKPFAKGQEKDQFRIDETDLFHFLKKRAGKLDGVVITGGEPTIHKDLPKFIDKIKKIGYLVKLDTNGTNPEMLQKLINNKMLDYIAMDIKSSLENYEATVGIKCDLKKIKKSVKIIIDSKLAYEFRTTLVPGLVSENDLIKIAYLIKGAEAWYLQKFRPQKNLVNYEFEKIKPYTDLEMKTMLGAVKKYVKKSELR